MTEPVAYLNKYLDKSTNITRYKPENQRLLSSDPLYTAEKLHPRVKMTQAEFDEFKQLWGSNDFWSSAENDILSYPQYEKLRNKIFFNDTEVDVKNTNDFAIIWANYNPERPEETIEITPEKKWFVQLANTKAQTRFLHKFIISCSLNYGTSKEYAQPFDTKEQADEWTNPLTRYKRKPKEQSKANPGTITERGSTKKPRKAKQNHLKSRETKRNTLI